MSDFQRIAKVIQYLAVHHRSQPSLDELAAIVDLSPFHFQRLFVRWAGVSPKKFLQLLTVNAVKKRLLEGQNVLDASLDVGLSGPSRLHDLTVSLEAATPGEIKSGGQDWQLSAGFATTPFGDCLIANSPRGICRLDFIEIRDRQTAEQQLVLDWPQTKICWDDSAAQAVAKRIFCQPAQTDSRGGLRCFVQGTEFQMRVWRALLTIPAGQLTTYAQIAKTIGNPNACRAVGTAIGSNPIGYLIPCHRVIRATGVIGQYRWGEIRKRAVIARELSNCDPTFPSNSE